MSKFKEGDMVKLKPYESIWRAFPEFRGLEGVVTFIKRNYYTVLFRGLNRRLVIRSCEFELYNRFEHVPEELFVI